MYLHTRTQHLIDSYLWNKHNPWCSPSSARLWCRPSSWFACLPINFLSFRIYFRFLEVVVIDDFVGVLVFVVVDFRVLEKWTTLGKVSWKWQLWE